MPVEVDKLIKKQSRADTILNLISDMLIWSKHVNMVKTTSFPSLKRGSQSLNFQNGNWIKKTRSSIWFPEKTRYEKVYRQ